VSRTLRGHMPESIVIGAALAHRVGYGGHAWALLQYVLGFQELGFEVTVVDRLDGDMLGGLQEEDALRYLRGLLAADGIAYGVLGDGGRSLDGLARVELLERTRSARFLVNVMGFVRDPELLAAAQRRVFLDIDPGFGQVWRELGLVDVFVDHDDFVTVGRNIGRDGCGVPTGGLRWVTIPHPVVLARCSVADGGDGFTSVGSWRGPYDAIDYEGRRLGLRAHEFRKLVELPTRVDAEFRVALEIDPADAADRKVLESNGWHLVEPSDVAPDPAAYLRFVHGSLAEFTVAKGIYVDLRTGWLGDRTACYLASGKPALVQDTGLADHYPIGEGLIAYSTLDDAVEGAGRILADTSGQSRAARRLAETELDSQVVLARLLEELGP
jgi:hypothetical protein